jgi:hypothetical protein
MEEKRMMRIFKIKGYEIVARHAELVSASDVETLKQVQGDYNVWLFDNTYII